MTIKYYLRKLDGASDAAGQYVPQTCHNDTVKLADLIDKVAAGKTAIGKGDIASIIENLCQIIESEVATGNIVHFGGIVRIWATVKGVFPKPDSSFNPNTHSIGIAACGHRRLGKYIAKSAHIKRVSPAQYHPVISQFNNVNTATVNKDITPAGLATINGSHLDYNPDDPDEGLYIVDIDRAEPDIKVTVIQRALKSKIIFQIPPAIADMTRCQLQLRRRQKAKGSLATGNSIELDVIDRIGSIHKD